MSGTLKDVAVFIDAESEMFTNVVSLSPLTELIFHNLNKTHIVAESETLTDCTESQNLFIPLSRPPSFH